MEEEEDGMVSSLSYMNEDSIIAQGARRILAPPWTVEAGLAVGEGL